MTMKFRIRVVSKSIVALKKFEGKKENYDFLRKCFFREDSLTLTNVIK